MTHCANCGCPLPFDERGCGLCDARDRRSFGCKLSLIAALILTVLIVGVLYG